MNGFEPLRRRIIDYTDAGQWSEVYDGPVEDCESEKLEAENARLRELGHQVVSMLGLGARSGEGLGREWCRELHDKYAPEFAGETDGEAVA